MVALNEKRFSRISDRGVRFQNQDAAFSELNTALDNSNIRFIEVSSPEIKEPQQSPIDLTQLNAQQLQHAIETKIVEMIASSHHKEFYFEVDKKKDAIKMILKVLPIPGSA